MPQVVFCEFCEIWFGVKIQKENVFKYFLKMRIYVLCIFKSNLL